MSMKCAWGIVCGMGLDRSTCGVWKTGTPRTTEVLKRYNGAGFQFLIHRCKFVYTLYHLL